MTTAQEQTEKILNHLKLIIFDSNASKEEVEYGAEYDEQTNKVIYHLKLKGYENYILNETTSLGYISKLDSEKAIKIINTYKAASQYQEFLDLNSFKYYKGEVSDFKQQYFFKVKNSNILFFPNLEKLLLVKNVRIAGGLFNEKIMLPYSKSVVLENFVDKLEELETIENTQAKTC